MTISVWHGTFANITEFRPFFHCGTWKAAVIRVVQKANDLGRESYANDPTVLFYPITIGKARILPFMDFGEDFHPSELMQTLLANPQTESLLRTYMADKPRSKRDQIAQIVYSFCMSHGVDGFSYSNHLEDSGSQSYIIVNTKITKIKKPVLLKLSAFVDVTADYLRIKAWNMVK